MNERTEPIPSEPVPQSDSPAFLDQLKIDHANRGLEHTQVVIQFVDSKTNILIGLVTAMAVATLYFLRIELGLESTDALARVDNSCGLVRNGALLFACLSLVAGGASILLCAWTNLSSPKSTSGKCVLLFPFFRSTSTEAMNEMRTKLHGMLCELDLEPVLNEFADQLANLGAIVERKIRFHRWATRTYVAQAGLSVLSWLFWFVRWV